MAMRLDTVNVDKIFNDLLMDVDLWGREGNDAANVLCYISGLLDMANAVKKAIKELGGK